MGDKRCHPKEDLEICENRRINSSSSADWLLEVCKQFYNPVYVGKVGKIHPFLNIFCYFCLSTELVVQEISWQCYLGQERRFLSTTMGALISYEVARDIQATTHHEIKSKSAAAISYIILFR